MKPDRPYVDALFADPDLIGFEIDGKLYNMHDVKILFAKAYSEEDIHTNPETCLHNVVQQTGLNRKDFNVVCVSCLATISYEWVLEVGKNYQYDIDHNVWVHEPVKKA